MQAETSSPRSGPPASELAVLGGTPVRQKTLPYGRQTIDDDDLRAVTEVLRSDWLTTGPKVGEFEQAFAEMVGAREAVAVANGTAALHAALAALGLGEGDEVIVPTLTFAASANAALYVGAAPVLVDVDPGTLLVDPAAVEAAVTPRTRAVVAVDYAGQPCDYEALRRITDRHGLALVADACHAPGAADRGRPVGSLADLSTFSLHPVKHFTTGEGGLITTDDPEAARRMRVFRNHGITTDHRERAKLGAYFYEMTSLGYNYRLSDIQCALGLSQLRKLEGWLQMRRSVAAAYDAAFAESPWVSPLHRRPEASHAYHLYVIRLRLDRLAADRDVVFQALRAEGIGVNVHYIPVHLHPYYREHLGTRAGLCPQAEAAYAEILSLPVFPGMAASDVDDVVQALEKVLSHYAR